MIDFCWGGGDLLEVAIEEAIEESTEETIEEAEMDTYPFGLKNAGLQPGTWITSLQIGFPREENFSSYSVWMLPLERSAS